MSAPRKTADFQYIQELFSEYESLTPLSEGAHGEVYRVEKGGKAFALKVLKLSGPNEKRLMRVFNREASSLACVRNPAIVNIFDAGVRKGHPYLVSEFIEGRTLDIMLRNGPMPLDRVVQMGRALAGAMVDLHRAGFIHRDLKPSNLMLDTSGQVHLIDFGLTGRMAPVLGDDDSSDQTVVGTPQYASPEQLRLTQGTIDGRTDLYSLGLILHECLTGKPVVQGTSLPEIFEQQLKGHPARLDHISPVIHKIIERLTAKDPDDRYANAMSLLRDLERFDRLTVEFNETKEITLFSGAHAKFQAQGKLIGRDEELARLRQHLVNIKAGRGGAALVRAGSGTGKSRLVQELLSSTDIANALVIGGKFNEEEQRPLGAIQRSWDEYINSLQGLTDFHKSQMVAALSRALGSSSSIVLDFSRRLQVFLNRAMSTTQQVEVSEELVAEALAQFFVDFCEQIKRPVVFVYDDVQWASAAARQMLNRLIAKIEKVPVFLMMTARPEGLDPLEILKTSNDDARLRAYVEQLDLGPLEDKDLLLIAEDILGGRSVPEEIEERILEFAAGNPYSVQQFIYSIIDLNIIQYRQGEWHVDQDRLSYTPLSNDLSLLLMERLKSIDARHREILELAATIGNQFSPNMLKEISGLNAEEFSKFHEEMLKGGLIETQDHNSSRFAHDKLFEATKKGIEADRAAIYHHRIAEYYQKRRSESSLEWAFHIYRAGSLADPRLVFEANAEAGEAAYRSNAIHKAAEFLGVASELMESVGAPREQMSNIYFLLGRIYRRLRDQQRAVDYCIRARDICPDDLLRVRIRAELMNIYLILNIDVEKARAEILQSYKELNEVSFADGLWVYVDLVRYIFKLIGLVLFNRTYVATGKERERSMALAMVDRQTIFLGYSSGQLKIPVNIPIRGVYSSLRIGASAETVYAYGSYLLLFGLLKKKKIVDRLARDAEAMAEDLGDPVLPGVVATNVVGAYFLAGDLIKSEQVYKKMVRRSSRWILPEDLYRLSNNLNLHFWLRGKFSEIESLKSLCDTQKEALGDSLRSSVLKAFELARLSAQGHGAHVAEGKKVLLEAIHGGQNPNLSKSAVTAQSILFFATIYFFIESEMIGDDLDRVIETYYSLGRNPKKVTFHGRHVYVSIAQARLMQWRAEKTSERRLQLRKAMSDLKSLKRSPEVQMHFLRLSAALLIDEGKPKEALPLLSQVEKMAGTYDAPLALYGAYAEYARAHKLLGQEARAMSCALFASQMAAKLGWKARDEAIRREFEIFSDRRAESSSRPTTRMDIVQSSNRYTDSLLRVSLAMSESLDPVAQARIAMDEMIRLVHAERGFLFIHDKGSGELKVQIGRNDGGEDLQTLEGYSQTVMKEMAKKREPMTIVADDQGELSQSESIAVQGLKSLMAVPMFLREEFVGAIYFDSRAVKGLFSTEDFEICKGISGHIAVAQEMANAAKVKAEKVAIEKDMALTGTVQSLFFPKETRYDGGPIELAGEYRPSTECSGDWWWYGTTPQGRLRVLALDVTGHGAASAMVTGLLATLVRMEFVEGRFLSTEVEELLSRMNQKLYEMIGGKYCSTVTVVEIDPETGLMEMWSAASPPIVVMNADGKREFIEVTGGLIGLDLEGFNVGHIQHQLAPGDRVYIFSDGLTELPVKRGQRFDVEKLAKIFGKASGLKSAQALEFILNETDKLIHDRASLDDITLIITDYKGSDKAA